jgi:glycosyltransferase involved in cell wall biosynthesis
MMACGCAVVSNTGRNVEHLLSPEVCQLAHPSPESLAAAILELLEDDQLRRKKVAAGMAFAQRTDWASEIKKIETAFLRSFNLPLLESAHGVDGALIRNA